MESKLAKAIDDYEEGRFRDALKLLEPLVKRDPGDVELRELYGLTLYRLGRWKAAIKELAEFETMTRSVEQHPVIADSYRALGDRAAVDRLWRELVAKGSSGQVPAEVMTEGRIVAAGAMADGGDLTAALALLNEGWRFPKRPSEHHLRRAYALADLYERAGEVPRARELFGRIAAAEPGFSDVDARLRYLG